MSHANGKIYADSNYGVSIEDVRSVLGDTSTDLGTLCTSSLINKWSKVKPVRNSSLSSVTPANRASVNFGFDLDSIITSSAASCLSLAETNAGVWPYLTPRGGAVTPNEPYRLTDFNGYNNNALETYETWVPGAATIYADASTKRFFAEVTKWLDTNAEITLTDFTNYSFGDWKIGIIYKGPSMSAPAIALSTRTIANSFVDDQSGEDPVERIYTGTIANGGNYKVAVCITDYDPDDETGAMFEFLYLPGAYGVVNVTDASSPTPTPITGKEVMLYSLEFDPTYDSVDDSLTSCQIFATFNDYTGDECPVVFRVRLYYRDATDNVEVVIARDSSITMITEEEIADVTFSPLGLNASDYEIEMEYQFEYDGDTTTYYVDPMTGALYEQRTSTLRRNLARCIDFWAE